MPTRPPIHACTHAHVEKSSLWTDTSVGQNFQKDLGAIGPYECQENFVWTNPLVSCYHGKSVWTDGPESLSKVPPENGMGPQMTLPNHAALIQHCPCAFYILPSNAHTCKHQHLPGTLRGVYAHLHGCMDTPRGREA